MSPVTRLFSIRGTRLYLAGTQKSVTPCNPNHGQEILCYVQEGLSSVVVRVQLNVSLHLELAATQKMLTPSDKTKKSAYGRFILKRPFLLFLRIFY
jgi:hypothetical protein